MWLSGKINKKTPSKTSSVLANTLVNLSSYELPRHQVSLLEKGLKFVPKADIDVSNVIGQIEHLSQSLSSEQATLLRSKAQQLLRKNERTRSDNLSRSERSALRELKRNKDIVIVPADKGNATVVMDKSLYESKITELLFDSTT